MKGQPREEEQDLEHEAVIDQNRGAMAELGCGALVDLDNGAVANLGSGAMVDLGRGTEMGLGRGNLEDLGHGAEVRLGHGAKDCGAVEQETTRSDPEEHGAMAEQRHGQTS